jgi:hypothetical protein
MAKFATIIQEPMRLKCHVFEYDNFPCPHQNSMYKYLLQMRDMTPSVAVHFQTLGPCSSAVLYTALYIGNSLEISLSAKAVKTSYRNTTMANTHVATTSQHCTPHHGCPGALLSSHSHSRTTILYLQPRCKLSMYTNNTTCLFDHCLTRSTIC